MVAGARIGVGTKTGGLGVEPPLRFVTVQLTRFMTGLAPVQKSKLSRLSASQMMLGSTFSPAEQREEKLDQRNGAIFKAFLSISVARTVKIIYVEVALVFYFKF